MKKKLILVVLAVALLITGCGQKTGKLGETGDQSKQVNIYNWGEYIDKSLLDKFEKETGIEVVYDTFTTNEELYVKMKNSGLQYDLLIPSDYMIEKMIKEDMLEKIDFSKIPNYKYVDQEFKNMDFDPKNEYSVPYFWGTLGILYNSKLTDQKVDSWDVIWDPKNAGEIFMLDSSRDAIGISLIRLGYSSNSRNEAELEEAKRELIKQYDLVRAYLVDEMKDMMKNEEASFAVMYSGDAVDALLENEDLRYVIPKEGSNIFLDSMVIPKDAPNKENAEKFINFMLEPENSAQNASIGYSTPISEAVKLLDEDYRDNKAAYPDKKDLEGLEAFRDPGEYIELYDEIWQEVKTQ